MVGHVPLKDVILVRVQVSQQPIFKSEANIKIELPEQMCGAENL